MSLKSHYTLFCIKHHVCTADYVELGKSSFSLNKCEDKCYHQLDAQIKI